MLDYNIQNLKAQIKHHEKHGNGSTAMKQKQLLKEAEHRREQRK